MSATAVGKRSAHWLIPALVLCIAIPTVVAVQGCSKGCSPQQPPPATRTPVPPATPTPLPENTFVFYNDEAHNLVCPNPAIITVREGNQVTFINDARCKVTVTPDPQVFERVEESFEVPVGGTVVQTVRQDLNPPITVELKMECEDGSTPAGCPNIPEGKHGPGMQVN